MSKQDAMRLEIEFLDAGWKDSELLGFVRILGRILGKVRGASC